MNDGDLRRELKEQLANAASRRDEDAQQERVTQERQEQNDDASADVAEVDDDAEPVEAEEQSEPLEITQETPETVADVSEVDDDAAPVEQPKPMDVPQESPETVADVSEVDTDTERPSIPDAIEIPSIESEADVAEVDEEPKPESPVPLEMPQTAAQQPFSQSAAPSESVQDVAEVDEDAPPQLERPQPSDAIQSETQQAELTLNINVTVGMAEDAGQQIADKVTPVIQTMLADFQAQAEDSVADAIGLADRGGTTS